MHSDVSQWELPSEVCKCLVGLCHLVSIFTLLEC